MRNLLLILLWLFTSFCYSQKNPENGNNKKSQDSIATETMRIDIIDPGDDSYIYYEDNDRDGYGGPFAIASSDPYPPIGYVVNSLDCNDNDFDIYPGAPELLDGKDNDCDGQVDEGINLAYLPINESFETGFGQWKQDTSDDIDWNRDKAGTPSTGTGPTTGDDGLYYLFLEASGYNNKRGYLKSPLFSIPDNYKMEFAYHMYGTNMGNLTLEVSTNGTSWSSIFSMSGNQGDIWNTASLDLSSYGGTDIYLRFNGLIGGGYASDIAIDNIKFLANNLGSSNLSGNENYVYSIKLREPVNETSEIESTTKKIESITYIDEIGRPKQSISIKAGGNNEDIITPITYDDQGRNNLEYLPYALTTSLNGAYKSNAISAQGSFYNTSKYENTLNPYTEKLFDGSPKDLVIETGAPGNDWDLSNTTTHSAKNDYQLLKYSDNVRDYAVVYNSSTDPFKPTLVDNGIFMSQQGTRPALLKLVTKNENWVSSDGDLNTSQTFIDFQNRTLLKRSFVIEGGSAEKVDTYYVYDDFGNLVFVLTPESEPTTAKPTQALLDDFCYQYKYDGRYRKIEKKLPGKQVEEIVYNDLGSPIMTRDGELKKQNKWHFTKYDDAGRVIYTGLMSSSGSRAIHQTNANTDPDLYESRKTSSPLSVGGAQLYYTNNSYPSSNISEILTIQYYDAYLPSVAQGYQSVPSNNFYGESKTLILKGLATVSRTRVLESSNPVKWVNTTIGYEKYGRTIWSKTENEHLSTVNIVHNDLDFDGSVLESKTEHSKTDISFSVDLRNYYTYDHMARMTEHSQKINSLAKELITRSTYDELGQLENKQVGGTTTGSGLQEINYSYNVRGWLKGINDITNLSNDIFSLRLSYNSTNLSGSTPLYNGNISEMTWLTANDKIASSSNTNRGYNYKYDSMSRLIEADYFQNSTNQIYSKYDMSASYDKNGNINHLARGDVYSTIDYLNYSYDGNQLVSVEDTGYPSSKAEGFFDGNTGTDYDYDDNGNLKFDLNKGITSITYNYLNLPKKISVSNASNSGYLLNTYSADGDKLEKYNEESNGRTYYAGNFVYKKVGSASAQLSFFHHPEGFVELNSGSFKYVFQFKDHLGNIRMNFTDTNNNNQIDTTNNEILEEKHYYPFGMQHKGNSYAIVTDHPYGFNGNEEIEELGLDLMDFNARNYNAELGRFMSMDPLAEVQNQIDRSPYAFSWNNPVILADPTGLIPWENDQDFQNRWGVSGYTYDMISDNNQRTNSGGCPDGDCPENTVYGGELDEVVITAPRKFDYSGMPDYLKYPEIGRSWTSSFDGGNLSDYNRIYGTDYGINNPGDALSQYTYRIFYKPQRDQLISDIHNAQTIVGLTTLAIPLTIIGGAEFATPIIAAGMETSSVTSLTYGTMWRQGVYRLSVRNSLGRFATGNGTRLTGRVFNQYYGLNGLGQATSFTPTLSSNIPTILRWTIGIGGSSLFLASDTDKKSK